MMQLRRTSSGFARREYTERTERDEQARVAEARQQRDNELIAALVGAVRALMGKPVRSEDVWVSSTERVAAVTVDGVRFRLEPSGLVLLRPCQHCGLGQLASPTLLSRADLNYALEAWQPRHADCEPGDPTEW